MTTSELISIYGAIGAAILGSFFGGIATYCASYFMARHQRADQQMSAMLKTYLKITQIRAEIENSRKSLHESFERANAKGFGHVQAWAKVSVKANEATPILITPDDLIPFAETESFDIFAGVVTSGMQHKAYCDSSNMYSKLRLELRTHVAGGDNIDKITVLDPKEFSQETQLRMLELNSLILSQLDLLPKFSVDTAKVANLIADLLLTKHNVNVKKFTFID